MQDETSRVEAIKQKASVADNALIQKEYRKAINLYLEILRLDPYYGGFWNNLGIALRSLGCHASALACTKRALDLSPSKLNYLVNIGNIYADLDRMNDALETISKAVQQEQKNIAYRTIYATTLRQAGKLEEALAQINIVCDLQPDNAEAKWERAAIYLSTGNLRNGWKDYEVRRERGNSKKRIFKAPQWTGQDLTGKIILLYEEQGFGDTILASRYIPLVKKLGAHVIVGCRPALHKLFKTIPGVDQVVDEGNFLLDYYAPLLTLPSIFDTGLDNIPPITKLFPAEKIPAGALELLELGRDRFKVGIIWSGNPDFKDNYKRAVPFSHFFPLIEIPGTQFYSLQMGIAAKELEECGAQSIVLELGPYLKDFADTAAVLEKLDLVIMTDSSVAHLAGSIMRPIWNLLNFCPYWLYMTGREDSPWYPSMRLFRQPKPGDWDTVFKKVAFELEKAVGLKKS